MKNNNIVIMYDIMKNVNRIYFKAQSLENSEMKWNYSGNGNITVTKDCEKVYFSEEIILSDGLKYFDKKLWNFMEDCIEFYRYRNGEYEKIFEFYLKNEEFVVKKDYWCSPDLYFGNIRIIGDKICFSVKIEGTRKNELLEYVYFRDYELDIL